MFPAAAKGVPAEMRWSGVHGGVGMERVGSMGSFTSAGEDVLAAWKELGGGGEIGAGWGRGQGW